jgi:sulfide:quinone oxidoreductase
VGAWSPPIELRRRALAIGARLGFSIGIDRNPDRARPQPIGGLGPMTNAAFGPSVSSMNDRPDIPATVIPPPLGSRVVIAGGGIAALEAMLALRALADERVTIELLAPEGDFVYRPLSVTAPFGLGEPFRLDLGEMVDRAGASLHRGVLASVDPERMLARTSAGAELPYDFLLVAVGGGRRNPLPGALAFGGDADVAPFRDLLEQVERGEVGSVAFALTGARTWSLPLYELALMTAAHLDRRGLSGVELTLVTPERRPLGLFGAQAAKAVERRLRRAGVELRTGEYACRCGPGTLGLVPDATIRADRVVTLAVAEPPSFPGLPADPDGFLFTDPHSRVPGLDGVYAAGDVTSFPLKQGGIAAQQADAAAEHIAAAAGALVTPRPFRAILRGLLLTEERPAYLRSEVSGESGRPDIVDVEPLWWPPAKIVAKYLGPYLAEQAGVANPDEIRDPEGLLVSWEADSPRSDWHELDPAEPKLRA